MTRYESFVLWIGLLVVSWAGAQQASDSVELGRLSNGDLVSFSRSGSVQWGIEIASGSAVRFSQPEPAQIELCVDGNNFRQLAAGYESVQKQAESVVATARVSGRQNSCCGRPLRVHPKY